MITTLYIFVLLLFDKDAGDGLYWLAFVEMILSTIILVNYLLR